MIGTKVFRMGLASRGGIRIGKERSWGLSLHDSLQDFVLMEAERQRKTKEAHKRLLNGYSCCGVEVCTGGESKKWWSPEVIEGGCIHRNVYRHLFGAEEGTEFIRLLMSPGWTARQLEKNGVLVLEGDFLLGIESVQEGRTDENARRSDDVKKTLEVILDAIKLAWPFVAKNKRELWFQLYGRLIKIGDEVGGVGEYMKRTEKEGDRPEVRIQSCLLAETGGVNTKIISVGVPVNCMVMMENRELFACGCWDGSVVVVNLRRGEIEKSWKAHDNDVLDIGIGGRNGTRLISVSSETDEKMGVWDLQSRKLLYTPIGHTDGIRCIAVTRNGEYAVTGSYDETVRVWNMRAMDGCHVVLEGHGTSVESVFVSDDGKRIISVDCEDNVFAWELETRQRVKEVSKENAQRLSRKQVLDVVEETTVLGDAGLSIFLESCQIGYGDREDMEVLGTLKAEVWSWAPSADGKTIHVGLKHETVGFMNLERLKIARTSRRSRIDE